MRHHLLCDEFDVFDVFQVEQLEVDPCAADFSEATDLVDELVRRASQAILP